MGQQQLLLIVLVTIIVGIATVVAITTFQSAQEQANMDAIRQDILRAHGMALTYFEKPLSMGGGGGSFREITLSELLLPQENDNAYYEITETSDENFTLSYIPHFSEENYDVVISYNRIYWNGEED